MLNFVNVYRPAETLTKGDRFRLTGGNVLFVEDIETVGDDFVISYYTFDLNRDRSKSTGVVKVKTTAKVREA